MHRTCCVSRFIIVCALDNYFWFICFAHWAKTYGSFSFVLLPGAYGYNAPATKSDLRLAKMGRDKKINTKQINV